MPHREDARRPPRVTDATARAVRRCASTAASCSRAATSTPRGPLTTTETAASRPTPPTSKPAALW